MQPNGTSFLNILFKKYVQILKQTYFTIQQTPTNIYAFVHATKDTPKSTSPSIKQEGFAPLYQKRIPHSLDSKNLKKELIIRKYPIQLIENVPTQNDIEALRTFFQTTSNYQNTYLHITPESKGPSLQSPKVYRLYKRTPN